MSFKTQTLFMIESTVRRVTNLRMKGNGMFWKEANAEAFMLMRANLLSEQWEAEVTAFATTSTERGGTKPSLPMES